MYAKTKSQKSKSKSTICLKDVAPTSIKDCSCSLDKKCLSGKLLYNASVNRLDTNETKHDYETSEKNFKERYNNDKVSFRYKSNGKSTDLSKYICDLKNNIIQHNLKWCITSKGLKVVRMYVEVESEIYA